MPTIRPWLQALRGLQRRPAYTLTTVIVLAMGIAIAATLFSVLDTVLLRPLPYPHSNQLVLVLESNPSQRQNASLVSPANLADWNRMNHSFQWLAGEYSESETDTSTAVPERLAGLRVSPGFFRIYGAPPVLGRTFTAAEDRFGGPQAAVISYRFWTRRFNRSPAVLGKRLLLGGHGYTIVGVMPADFTSSKLDLWLPAQLPPFLTQSRTARFYSGIGRLKPGVTIAQAGADLARVQARLGRKYPASDAGWSAQVSSLKEFLVGSYRDSLWMIFAAVMLLLALAVANIGGLMLAQLQGRGREMAIRSAIGASRPQLVGTVMREVSLLAMAGAALGGGLAWLGIRGIAVAAPGVVPRMAELRLDPRGWLFAVGVSALAAVGFGLIPALTATRPGRMASGAAGSLLARLNAGTLSGGRRTQRILVVAQLALTLLLIAAAGLLLRSFTNLAHVQTGFDDTHVLTFHVSASWNEDRTRLGSMQTALLAKLRQLPGVTAAGFTNFLPASMATLQYQIRLQGAATPGQSGMYSVGERTVTSGYLRALDVPLLQGSWCPPVQPTSAGSQGGLGKAMVNLAFVNTYLHGATAVGRPFTMAAYGSATAPGEIVGVVGNVRENNLAAAATPFLYMCLPAGSWPDPEYVVRAAGNPSALMPAIRAAVRQIAPDRAVFGLQRLSTVVNASLAQPRLSFDFLSLFAAFAMLLAAVGLYGLISRIVASQTREMGVRLALGARPIQLAGMVLGATAKTLLWGAAAGLLLIWAAGRWLDALLYGITALDPGTLAATLALLAAVTLLAAWIPARRAAATDPVIALRTDL